MNGTVVDFINYGPFVGNVADIVLTLAAVGIIGGVLFSQPFGIAWLDKLVYGGEDEREHGERGANSESGENTVLGESEAQN